MSTKHVPLCQTKGCPHPSDPDWHRCFVCKKESIDHQHYPKKSLAGKGATIVAALCRNHHEKITLHRWREGVYTHPNGSKRYYVQNQKGETMCDVVIEGAPQTLPTAPPGPVEGRPAHPGGILPATDEETPPHTNLTRGASFGDVIVTQALETTTGPAPGALKEPVSLESVPDEQLAALFAEADKRQAEGFLLKCRIVHTFRERHVQSWGSSWTESAYDLFHISRRTLNVYANLHEILDTSDPYLTEQIAPLTDSKSLMTHIGRKKVEDGKVALEAAVAHQAEFGEPPTVANLQHRLGEEAAEPETCPEYEDGKHRFVCGCGKERS